MAPQHQICRVALVVSIPTKMPKIGANMVMGCGHGAGIFEFKANCLQKCTQGY